MKAVVLCGGQSIRMNKDKGLIKTIDGVRWSELACHKLARLGIPVFLSVNRDQRGYGEIFLKDALIVDGDSINAKGPLLGLMSFHQMFPDEDLFILACDMTDIGNEVLDFLYVQFNATNSDVCIFSNGRHLEPLCGIYSSKGLSRIFNLCTSRQIRKFSRRYILSQLDVAEESLPFKWVNNFMNYNTP